MNNRKGMSQTLALIVAASVLMMTALTVIFLASGSLGDFGETSNQNACLGAVQSKCTAQGTTHVALPPSCTEAGNVPQAFEDAYQGTLRSSHDVDGDGTNEQAATCPGN